MSDRYDCEACGANVDSGSNHEDACPGSPADRAEALEERVSALDDRVGLLADRVLVLENRVYQLLSRRNEKTSDVPERRVLSSVERAYGAVRFGFETCSPTAYLDSLEKTEGVYAVLNGYRDADGSVRVVRGVTRFFAAPVYADDIARWTCAHVEAVLQGPSPPRSSEVSAVYGLAGERTPTCATFDVEVRAPERTSDDTRCAHPPPSTLDALACRVCGVFRISGKPPRLADSVREALGTYGGGERLVVTIERRRG